MSFDLLLHLLFLGETNSFYDDHENLLHYETRLTIKSELFSHSITLGGREGGEG
jgi:hypothetical protein